MSGATKTGGSKTNYSRMLVEVLASMGDQESNGPDNSK